MAHRARGARGSSGVNDAIATDASGRDGKIVGVLTATQSLGSRLEQVMLGLGINVAERPGIEPTVFRPRVLSFADVTGGGAPRLGAVLAAVLAALSARYGALLAFGPAGLLA
ncbi:MAG: hypothetical protein ABIF77_16755, partial [bacterium]